MPRRKPPADSVTSPERPSPGPGRRPSTLHAPDGDSAITAFDLFVERGLHQLYDSVLAEPIPENLLRLIEDDRSK